MAYVSQEFKKQVAPIIKKICDKYGVKASLAVSNHSTLVLNIKAAKIDFIKNYNETVEKRSDGRDFHRVTDGHIQVNTKWTDEHYTGKAKAFFKEATEAMCGPNYFDHSDSMTDYFHCSHYISINVGKWNKPFEVI